VCIAETLCIAVEGAWRRYFVCGLESCEWIDIVSGRRLPVQGPFISSARWFIDSLAHYSHIHDYSWIHGNLSTWASATDSK